MEEVEGLAGVVGSEPDASFGFFRLSSGVAVMEPERFLFFVFSLSGGDLTLMYWPPHSVW
jgi:hypothetical protein